MEREREEIYAGCRSCHIKRADEDERRAELLCDCKQRLLSDHLLVWVPSFCAEVAQAARTDLYRGIAAVLPCVLGAI